MEALARWTNEAGERVPPDVFIPVAEETGLIGELGARRCCAARPAGGGLAAARARSASGSTPAPTSCAASTYFDEVMAILEEAGLAARLLGLEITESIFVDDDKVTQDNLARLRDAGVSLLIDDFGTGYSSLSYLQRFPVVDVLKIDRSFLGEGTRGEAVVQAVVGLGRAFGLQVCAEGVETPEQHARVRRARLRLRPGLPAGPAGAGGPDRRPHRRVAAAPAAGLSLSASRSHPQPDGVPGWSGPAGRGSPAGTARRTARSRRRRVPGAVADGVRASRTERAVGPASSAAAARRAGRWCRTG